MTKNQIEFNKLLETQRANRRQEELTALRDSRAHQISLGTLEETRRSNLAKEAYNVSYLDETSRSNQAQELLSYGNLREQIRSNKARESETRRSNVARETETKRANITSEQLRSQELAERIRSNLSSESIGRSQVGLGYSQLAESHRANVARENETNRSNLAKEEEINRSNLAREMDVDLQRMDQMFIDLNRVGLESRKLDLASQRLDLDTDIADRRHSIDVANSILKGLSMVPDYIKLIG